MSRRNFDFGDLVHELNRVRGLDDFIRFFDHQTVEVQVIIGVLIFGLLVLVWIFTVAIFVDKHI